MLSNFILCSFNYLLFTVKVLPSRSEFWNIDVTFPEDCMLSLFIPAVLALFTICLHVCVCECISSLARLFFIVAQQQMVSPRASCPLLINFLPACSAACCSAFTLIFHHLLLLYPWGQIVRVQTPLESYNHKHSLLFTTTCLEAISVTQQSVPQQGFLFF